LIPFIKPLKIEIIQPVNSIFMAAIMNWMNRILRHAGLTTTCGLWTLFMLGQTDPVPLTGVTNAEPGHAYYELGEKRIREVFASPLTNQPGSYQYSFDLPEDWSQKQIFTRVENLVDSFQLKINGFTFGIGVGKALPVEFNITPFVNSTDNIIEVKGNWIYNQGPVGSDLPMVLITRDPIHIRDIRIHNYFDEVSEKDLVRIGLRIISYQGRGSMGRNVEVSIEDPLGELIYQENRSLNFPLAFRQEVEFTFEAAIDQPMLWSTGNPQLYRVITELKTEGSEHGEMLSATFGIRHATLVDSVLVVNADTIRADKIHRTELSFLLESAGEDLESHLKDQNIRIIQSAGIPPGRVLNLFDRTGILFLHTSGEIIAPHLMEQVNHPSLIIPK
jgi:hypothetical protein